MARLPFPVEDSIACQATASITNDPPTADLMRFYCTQHWDAAEACGEDHAGRGMGAPEPCVRTWQENFSADATTEYAGAPCLRRRGAYGL